MATRDAFDILGLAARYDLDRAEVNAAYLRAIAGLHPDVAGEGELPGEVDARAAELNVAKRTLDDPESRADALLARLGGPTREEERGLPAGFLAEIMEARTEMQAAAGAGDPGRLGEWERWARERRGEVLGRIAGLFGRVGVSEGGLLREIRVELNALRYFERMIEQVGPAGEG